MVHEGDRSDIVQPHILPQRHAGRGVRVYADDEDIGLLGREFQEPQMPGVHDIEIPGHKRNALTGFARIPDRLAGLKRFGQLVQGI